MTNPTLALNDEAVRQQVAEELADGVTVAGRQFVRATNLTFEHFNHRVDLVRRSGVLNAFRYYKPDFSENEMDIFVGELIMTAIDSGLFYMLLADLLVEEGQPWSQESAHRNARTFQLTATPADHLAITNVFLWLLLDFFINGVVSNPIIQKYLWARDRLISGPVASAETRPTEILKVS